MPSAVTLFGQRSPQGPRRKQRGRTHKSNNGTSSSHASGVRERPHSRLAEERPPSDLHLLSAQTSSWESREKRRNRRRRREKEECEEKVEEEAAGLDSDLKRKPILRSPPHHSTTKSPEKPAVVSAQNHLFNQKRHFRQVFV